MPRLVDPASRREQLAEAVWRVIRRDGLERASVRTVAREAGLSAGSLRHYFGTQTELLAFAMGLVVDRVQARVARHGPAADPRAAVETVLHELLPLDPDRRAETEVWLAFSGQALVDPVLRDLRARADGLLAAGYRRMLDWLAAGGQLAAGLDLDLEAERLGALVDGLAMHAAGQPSRVRPELVLATVRRHLDSLRPVPAR